MAGAAECWSPFWGKPLLHCKPSVPRLPVQLASRELVKGAPFPVRQLSIFWTSGPKGTHFMTMFAFLLRLKWLEIPINSLSYTV